MAPCSPHRTNGCQMTSNSCTMALLWICPSKPKKSLDCTPWCWTMPAPPVRDSIGTSSTTGKRLYLTRTHNWQKLLYLRFIWNTLFAAMYILFFFQQTLSWFLLWILQNAADTFEAYFILSVGQNIYLQSRSSLWGHWIHNLSSCLSDVITEPGSNPGNWKSWICSSLDQICSPQRFDCSIFNIILVISNIILYQVVQTLSVSDDCYCVELP